MVTAGFMFIGSLVCEGKRFWLSLAVNRVHMSALRLVFLGVFLDFPWSKRRTISLPQYRRAVNVEEG